MQIIKIETGIAAKPTGDNFGPGVAKFTFAGGATTYAAVEAFPSVAVMVQDATNEDCFINDLLVASLGQVDEVNSGAESVSEWTEVFSA